MGIRRLGRLAVVGASAVLALVAPMPGGGAQTPPALPGDPVPLCEVEAPAPGTLPTVRTANGGGLKVASFNVLHTLEDEADATLDRRVELAVAALADAGIDVVGAQEVVSTANHGRVAERMAQGLAAATGTAWSWCWFQSNPHFPGEPDVQPGGGGGGPLSEAMATQARAGDPVFREGVAILSRHPILDAGVRRLPPRSYEAPACIPPDPLACNAAAAFDSRSVLRARVATPGEPVDVYTTHIAHGLTDLSPVTKLVHTLSALRYVEETATADATPDFLVGDFNSVEGSDVHAAVLAAGFVDTFRAANPAADGFTSDQHIRATHPTVTARIDYVFARPGSAGFDVGASKVFANKKTAYLDGWLWPSDHFGVVSTVR